MGSEVEQFAQRLREQLVLTGDLQTATAIEQALQPETIDQEYPRLVYRNGNRSDYCTVNDPAEETAAQQQGYQRIPLPLPEPKYFCERPRSEGGTTYDPRRVILFGEEQVAEFYAAIEEGAWIPDTVENRFGCRGISLAAVIAERKQILKDLIDVSSLAPAAEAEGDNHG